MLMYFLAAGRVYLVLQSPAKPVGSYPTLFTIAALCRVSCVVSVALSLKLLLVAVSNCLTLCRPDFPLAVLRQPAVSYVADVYIVALALVEYTNQKGGICMETEIAERGRRTNEYMIVGCYGRNLQEPFEQAHSWIVTVPETNHAQITDTAQPDLLAVQQSKHSHETTEQWLPLSLEEIKLSLPAEAKVHISKSKGICDACFEGVKAQKKVRASKPKKQTQAA